MASALSQASSEPPSTSTSSAPNARIIATADTLAQAEDLYAEGASYVVIPAALAAEHLYRLLRDTSDDVLDRARAEQARELFARSPKSPKPVTVDGGRR
jgi:Trk K+ transport system NAD-binding subunit